MKIVRKDQYSTCEFGELKTGDVFVEDIDGKQFIQMKVEETDWESKILNSVDLTTGLMYSTDPGTKVKRVHAELIISNIEEVG